MANQEAHAEKIINFDPSCREWILRIGNTIKLVHDLDELEHRTASVRIEEAAGCFYKLIPVHCRGPFITPLSICVPQEKCRAGQTYHRQVPECPPGVGGLILFVSE